LSVSWRGGVKKLGKLSGKTILYFEIIITVAIVVGLLSSNFFQTGASIDRGSLE
jgi:proton glutamate symport protein